MKTNKITATITASPSELLVDHEGNPLAGTCDADIYCDGEPVGEATLMADAASGDYQLQGDSLDCWASSSLISWIEKGDRHERIAAILDAVNEAD